jgi:hypothetical protein
MIRMWFPAALFLAVAISVGVSGCAFGPAVTAAKANPSGWTEPSAGGTTTASAASTATASAGVATQSGGSAQSSDACTVIQRDVTATMNELQVSGFSDWELSLNSGNVVGGASITTDPGRLRSAMQMMTSTLDGLDTASGPGEAISVDLSDTGANFEALESGSGTVADEAQIVHGLSNAAADAFSACGPSPYTQYAPAQESALDDTADVAAVEGFTVGVLSPDITTTKSNVKQVVALSALGPQGADGDCAVPFKMDSFVQQAAGAEDDFEHQLGIISVGASLDNRDIIRLQSDLATITEERISPPRTAQQSLVSATQALTQGIAVANADIDTENGLMVQAFSVDNKMAESPACVNAAAGKPPVLGHISLSS